jgi:hypothetical protein
MVGEIISESVSWYRPWADAVGILAGVTVMEFEGSVLPRCRQAGRQSADGDESASDRCSGESSGVVGEIARYQLRAGRNGAAPPAEMAQVTFVGAAGVGGGGCFEEFADRSIQSVRNGTRRNDPVRLRLAEDWF